MRLDHEDLGLGLEAPAKLNVCLTAGESDGQHHQLDTVFMSISLSDRVRVRRSATRSRVLVTGATDGVPQTSDNMALIAARQFFDYTGLNENVHIALEKRIPVGAGLGGGSADAAATLILCNQMFGTRLPQSELMGLAASLGTDVPFLVIGGVGHGVGHGEIVHSVPGVAASQFNWTLAFTSPGLSTAAVFAEFDTRFPDAFGVNEELSRAVISALLSGDAAQLSPLLENCLADSVLELSPNLHHIVCRGVDSGLALGALVCGAGSTAAFLTRSIKDARTLSSHLKQLPICHWTSAVSGPATVERAGNLMVPASSKVSGQLLPGTGACCSSLI